MKPNAKSMHVQKFLDRHEAVEKLLSELTARGQPCGELFFLDYFLSTNSLNEGAAEKLKTDLLTHMKPTAVAYLKAESAKLKLMLAKMNQTISDKKKGDV